MSKKSQPIQPELNLSLETDQLESDMFDPPDPFTMDKIEPGTFTEHNSKVIQEFLAHDTTEPEVPFFDSEEQSKKVSQLKNILTGSEDEITFLLTVIIESVSRNFICEISITPKEAANIPLQGFLSDYGLTIHDIKTAVYENEQKMIDDLKRGRDFFHTTTD